MTGQTPQSIRVLVIEDKEDDFAFVRLLLSRKTLQNYELTWAPTFESGREIIAKGEHDVALCDHNLGMETGVDLIKFATATGVTMPIILLTGADNLLIDQEAAASGAVWKNCSSRSAIKSAAGSAPICTTISASISPGWRASPRPSATNCRRDRLRPSRPATLRVGSTKRSIAPVL